MRASCWVELERMARSMESLLLPLPAPQPLEHYRLGLAQRVEHSLQQGYAFRTMGWVCIQMSPIQVLIQPDPA